MMKILFSIYDFFYTKLIPEFYHDRKLLNQLDRCLKSYPNLRRAVPQNWPRHPRYDITNKRMHRFQRERKRKAYEGMNLPLFLHFSEFDLDKNMRELFQSILMALDWFSAEMIDTPGAKSVLEPLWSSSWDLLRIWSVVSEIFFIRHLKQNTSFDILGFDRQIPGSKKTADIHVVHLGKDIWIDIEALALRPFKGTHDQFRRLLVSRAKKKMKSKFSDLPSDNTGMIASVYRITSPENQYLFQSDSLLTKPIEEKNICASIFWLIQGRRLGSRDPFGLHLDGFIAFDKME
jgi:hypothetical protein